MPSSRKNGQYGKQYCVVQFHPKKQSDTALFAFGEGSYLSEKRMENYIHWFLNQNFLSVKEILFRTKLTFCEQLKAEDPYIDWNYIPRQEFRTWERQGRLLPIPVSTINREIATKKEKEVA